MNQVINRFSTSVFSILIRARSYTRKLIKTNSYLSKLYSDTQYRIQNRQQFVRPHAHEHMLADSVRINAYHAAISKFIKRGDTVIDLGTGTGILSFFAAQKGAKKIYALEHSGVIEVAKRVATHNKIDNIEFIQTHSKTFTLDTPVDAIIHEQMGHLLFEEHMVENICDLRDRLLVKGGIIIPSRFEFFIEPIKVKDFNHIPLIKEQKIHGIDFSCLKGLELPRDYYFLQRNEPELIDYFLCDPQPIYSFDLHTVNPTDIPRELSYSRIVKRGGRLDGFIVYFRCILDEDLTFTTAPTENRATNWTCHFLRVESRTYDEGQPLHFDLKAEHLETPKTWQWSHR
jgi:type I protein arginine methyltransferase